MKMNWLNISLIVGGVAAVGLGLAVVAKNRKAKKAGNESVSVDAPTRPTTKPKAVKKDVVVGPELDEPVNGGSGAKLSQNQVAAISKQIREAWGGMLPDDEEAVYRAMGMIKNPEQLDQLNQYYAGVNGIPVIDDIKKRMSSSEAKQAFESMGFNYSIALAPKRASRGRRA